MSFVEAVLFAEFDIDKGSVCRVQYPRDVGDASILAELMLPEGAHNHCVKKTLPPLQLFCLPPLSQCACTQFKTGLCSCLISQMRHP